MSGLCPGFWPGPGRVAASVTANSEQLRVILMRIFTRAHNGDKRRLKDWRNTFTGSRHLM